MALVLLIPEAKEDNISAAMRYLVYTFSIQPSDKHKTESFTARSSERALGGVIQNNTAFCTKCTITHLIKFIFNISSTPHMELKNPICSGVLYNISLRLGLNMRWK
jgi:hypothetical protein